jgi:hypothetical protein
MRQLYETRHPSMCQVQNREVLFTRTMPIVSLEDNSQEQLYQSPTVFIAGGSSWKRWILCFTRGMPDLAPSLVGSVQ